MEWGLQIAGHARLTSLVVESNSQEVVNFVDNRQGGRTEID